jgi:sugar phosphate isomerase/epimerase
MLQIKTAIQLASLRLPFRKALLTAAQLGASAVEIDARTELRPAELSQTGVREVRKMLEDFNLRVSAVTFRTRRGYATAEDLQRRIEATHEALDLAYRLGAGVVINHVGRIPPEDSPDWNTLLGALVDLGRYGQKAGALLAADTGTEEGPELARLLSALPAGSIGVNLNPAQVVMHGFSPSEMTRAVGRHVLHVYANDATRDLAMRRGVETALGRGSVDWQEVLSLLEEAEYRGWFTIERRDSNNPIAEIGDAVKFLKSI